MVSKKMEKACRIIINDILEGKISTRRELEIEKENAHLHKWREI